MSGQHDPDDVGPLLDPTGGPDEPTPEFTPTPEAEELAKWVAGIEEEESVGNHQSGSPSPGRRFYARPPDEAFDTPSALEAWIDLFLEVMLGQDDSGP